MTREQRDAIQARWEAAKSAYDEVDNDISDRAIYFRDDFNVLFLSANDIPVLLKALDTAEKKTAKNSAVID